MTDQEIINLIEKYNQGTANTEERMWLESWYNQHAKNNSESANPEQLEERMKHSLPFILNHTQHKKSNIIPLVWKIAAALTAITLGVWLYYISSNEHAVPHTEFISTSQLIVPGGNLATLTLANGKVITLDTNKASVVVADSVSVATMLAANTPKGGTYRFLLPDGSAVWLNADSKLEFASDLGRRTQRFVKLTGEAYFEIKKDKTRPFVVKTNTQEVEVLGTHFNIKAYSDEQSVLTTLVEGSVKVNQSTILKPGEQSVLTKQELKVSTVNIDEALAWKNEEFYFDKDNFEHTMNMISRWYNVEIVYDYKPKGLRLTGQVSRNRSIEEVLEILQNTDEIKFKVEGRRIHVIR